MKDQKAIPNIIIPVFLATLLTVLLVPSPAQADWLKMDPPPDVDKYDHNHADTNSCWLVAAADVLSGAGYGDGNDVQERADEIYLELCGHFDPNDTGWSNAAMTWWLASPNNTWDDNPYTVVLVRGRTAERYPWANPNLPKFIGNRLRDCNMFTLSIRRPTCDANVGIGGHAITAWGDNGDSNDLTDNPNDVWVTDSDRGNIMVWEQKYTYDDYNNPNPDGCNEGVGWYINYWRSPHWYIDSIVILSTTDGNGPALTQTASVSTVVHYKGDSNGTDLYYTIYSDANILSYNTTIDWPTNANPIYTEDTNEVGVHWDLEYNEVPNDTYVTISAQVVLPHDPNDPNVNSVGLKTMYWLPVTFDPIAGSLFWGWHYGLPGGHNYYAPNMCGGYVISSFNIYKEFPVAIYTLLGEYRFQHEYEYFQHPEIHDLFLRPEVLPPPEPPGAVYVMGDFRFGHSYGLLLEDELWQFNGPWLTYEFVVPPYPPLQPWLFEIRWPGQLPYPQGQDYHGPTECGDPGTVYLKADLNEDCYVNFKDFAKFALDWMACTDPEDPNCS